MNDAFVYANPRLPLLTTGVADGAACDGEEDGIYAGGLAELDAMDAAVDEVDNEGREEEVAEELDDTDELLRVFDVTSPLVPVRLVEFEVAYTLLRYPDNSADPTVLDVTEVSSRFDDKDEEVDAAAEAVMIGKVSESVLDIGDISVDEVDSDDISPGLDSDGVDELVLGEVIPIDRLDELRAVACVSDEDAAFCVLIEAEDTLSEGSEWFSAKVELVVNEIENPPGSDRFKVEDGRSVRVTDCNDDAEALSVLAEEIVFDSTGDNCKLDIEEAGTGVTTAVEVSPAGVLKSVEPRLELTTVDEPSMPDNIMLVPVKDPPTVVALDCDISGIESAVVVE